MNKKKEIKDEKIEIRITKSKKDIVNNLCKNQNITKSDLINYLLDGYIGQNYKF